MKRSLSAQLQFTAQQFLPGDAVFQYEDTSRARTHYLEVKSWNGGHSD